MAKKENKKALKQKNDFYHRQNRKLYTRMREAEETLAEYEKHIAGQFTLLTSRYEGIICYLIRKLGWDGVVDSEVAEWAKDKEYVLKAKYNDDNELIWTPVIAVIEDDVETE